MSVYVDELSACLQTEKWQYDQSCHLVADSVKELQEFARVIKLSRSWFQNKPELPHYDLTPGMRCRAVAFGAIEIDREKIVEMMKNNRSKKGIK